MATIIVGAPDGKSYDFQEYTGKMDPGPSPTERYKNGVSTVQRVLLCDWADREQVMRGLLGYSYLESGAASKKKIARVLPHHYAPSGANAWLWAQEVSIQGKGKPTDGLFEANDVARYEKAVLTVQYSSLPYDVLGDGEVTRNSDGNPDELYRYTAYKVRSAGQYLPLPRDYVRFSEGKNNGQPIPGGGAGLIEPSGEFTIKWFQVPERAVPSCLVNPDLKRTMTEGTYDTTVGKVNATAFFGFAAGEVLCMPAEFGDPKRDCRGYFYYDIEYKFKWDPNSFHKVMSSPDGRYVAVVRVGDATKAIYEEATLENLFKPNGG